MNSNYNEDHFALMKIEMLENCIELYKQIEKELLEKIKEKDEKIFNLEQDLIDLKNLIKDFEEFKSNCKLK